MIAKNRKMYLKILILILLVIFFAILNFNKVQAASISSDINGINEAKYPGYKNYIKTLQNQYPNWSIKLYYTGINWEDAISGEYVGHGNSPSSLSYYTYTGEWICPICGDQTFDVSHKWYCASRKAIAYMMDPRNSLTDDYIFQFQNLGSSSGTRSEIEKMVRGTFLSEPSVVTAIMEAAQQYQISPFHLVSRITQEQGTSGLGKMNGYAYKTEDGRWVKVFNLFNINVSGNDTEQGFLEGAKTAYENGWFTKEDSIKGGAKFLREKYIDVGQNTLYFEKYNVVDLNNLYQHQYMQNIRAANDEGNNIYTTYKKCGILSSHFEFIIPVYENMPSSPAPRPLNNEEDYRGDIATEITQIQTQTNSKGETYLKGKIVVTEWIDGITWSKPKDTPKIRFKELDSSKCYNLTVKNIESNTYSFEGCIDDINVNKKYEIQVESGNSNNTSPYKIARAYSPTDKTIGKYRRHILNMKSNIITLTPTNYCGDVAPQIIKTELAKNEQGRPFIKGEIYITEWLGPLWSEPDVTPIMTLVSTKDNKEKAQFWVNKISGNKYYFDQYIDGLDMTQQYIIKVQLNNPYNTSSYKSAQVQYPNNITLGEYDGSKVKIVNSKLKFEGYRGDIATEIQQLELLKNERGTYVKGEIIITEWIDGKTWSMPKKTPIMTIKQINGNETYGLWVNPIEGNKYYFDGYIDGMSAGKQYEIKVESANINNISPYRVATAYYPKNKQLGTYQDNKVKIENNKILVQKDIYSGDVATEIQQLELLKNEKGTYIKGEIIITEWLNGKTWSIPKATPIMRIKQVNSNTTYGLWVNPIEGNKYYFDGYIDSLDISNQYIIEVESGSKNNTSTHKIATAYYPKNKELGVFKNSKLKIENNIFKFSNTNLKNIETKQKVEQPVVKNEYKESEQQNQNVIQDKKIEEPQNNNNVENTVLDEEENKTEEEQKNEVEPNNIAITK